MAVTTLKEVIRAEIAACTALTAYLTSIGRDPATVLYPRADDSPGGDTPTPFIVARPSDETGDVLLNSGFTLYIYDAPEEQYWRIEEIVNILRRYFDRKRLAPTVAGYTAYTRSFHSSTGKRQVDDAWNKDYEFLVFDVPAVY